MTKGFVPCLSTRFIGLAREAWNQEVEEIVGIGRQPHGKSIVNVGVDDEFLSW